MFDTKRAAALAQADATVAARAFSEAQRMLGDYDAATERAAVRCHAWGEIAHECDLLVLAGEAMLGPPPAS